MDRRMRVRAWPVVGLVLAVLWVAVRGVALAPRALAGELLIGLVVGQLIAYGFRQWYESTVDVRRGLRATPIAVYYVVVFLWGVVVSSIDMAYRVLHPAQPIEPDVVELPLRVQTDFGITSIANTITLTPGTVTMDHDSETNTLYVHGVIGHRRETTVAPIRRWEDLLLVILDEELDPSDPPPSRPGRRAPAARRVEPTSGPRGDDGGS